MRRCLAFLLEGAGSCDRRLLTAGKLFADYREVGDFRPQDGLAPKAPAATTPLPSEPLCTDGIL